MTLIQGCRRPQKERNFKDFSGSLSALKFTHNMSPVDIPIVDPIVSLFKSFVTKYTKKDLQKIPKIILKAWILTFDGLYKQL